MDEEKDKSEEVIKKPVLMLPHGANGNGKSEEVIRTVETSFGTSILKKVLEPKDYALTSETSLKELVKAMVHSDELNHTVKRDEVELFEELSRQIAKLTKDYGDAIHSILNKHVPEKNRYPTIIHNLQVHSLLTIEIPRIEGERTTHPESFKGSVLSDLNN